MAGGISRVRGTVGAPKVFSGVALKDYTLSFWAGQTGVDLATDLVTTEGALEKAFRTAVGTVGTVSRVGTLDTGTKTIRFSVEMLGDDAFSPGTLGTGPNGGTPPATTALALQAAIRALGDVTTPGTASVIYLTSATVAAFTY